MEKVTVGSVELVSKYNIIAYMNGWCVAYERTKRLRWRSCNLHMNGVLFILPITTGRFLVYRENVGLKFEGELYNLYPDIILKFKIHTFCWFNKCVILICPKLNFVVFNICIFTILFMCHSIFCQLCLLKFTWTGRLN